jgi:hypothetical protein
MKQHVDLLGILFMVAGFVSLLLGASLLSLGIGAAAIVTTGDYGGARLAAYLTAAAFLAVAVAVLIWGGASLWTGAALRRHRPMARLVALVLAALNLVVIPFGTALGIYGLWVLLNERARQLFEPATT